MGSKKLKALVVEGNGSVNVKDPKALADLSDYMLREVVGSNNNHVVPSTQQEWAEYYDKGTRWTARKACTGPTPRASRSRPASRSRARSTPSATAA